MLIANGAANHIRPSAADIRELGLEFAELTVGLFIKLGTHVVQIWARSSVGVSGFGDHCFLDQVAQHPSVTHSQSAPDFSSYS